MNPRDFWTELGVRLALMAAAGYVVVKVLR